jgi:uncharacterized Zn finger protein/predicted flap endonuclease-1-like 5' DNA nuclease
MGWFYYSKKSPLSIEHGYQTKNRSGEFGKTWIGNKWMNGLKNNADSTRMSRGKGYVRKGQVADIKVLLSEITAKVQGTTSKPYKIQILPNLLSDTNKRKLKSYLKNNPKQALAILNNNLTEDLATIFDEISIFPKNLKSIKYKCSCPDYGFPCKHVAAVICVIADLIDKNPTILFLITGYDPELLIADINEILKTVQSSEIIVKRETESSNDTNGIEEYLSKMMNSEFQGLNDGIRTELSLISVPVQQIRNINEEKHHKLGNLLYSLKANLREYWLQNYYISANQFLESFDSQLSKELNYDLQENHSFAPIRMEKLITEDKTIVKSRKSMKSKIDNDVLDELMQLTGIGKGKAQLLVSDGINCIHQIANSTVNNLRASSKSLPISEFRSQVLIRLAKQIVSGQHLCIHDVKIKKS